MGAEDLSVRATIGVDGTAATGVAVEDCMISPWSQWNVLVCLDGRWRQTLVLAVEAKEVCCQQLMGLAA